MPFFTIGDLGTPVQDISATNSAGAALTTATAVNVTSVTLTPGEWLVYGTGTLTATTAVTGTQFLTCISLTSATVENAETFPNRIFITPTAPTTVAQQSCPVVYGRVTVSVDTLIYLVARSTFTAGGVTARGRIQAIRL